MSSAPLPITTLTLLSHLPTHTQGSKLRFLGCVTSFDSRTGILELHHHHHRYPSPPLASTTILASVDVNLLLETIKRQDLEVGAWVNVIGYLGDVSVKEGGGGRRRWRRRMGKSKVRVEDDGESDEEGREVVEVQVQAMMLWNAGGIKLAEYEKAVEDRVKRGKCKSPTVAQQT